MGALFKLHSNVLGNQLRVRFRIFDFHHVYERFAAGHRFQFFAQGFNIGTFFADYHARAGRVNVDAQERTGSFNADVADGRHFEFFVNKFADLEIFHNQRGHILRREPFGTPILNITQSN